MKTLEEVAEKYYPSYPDGIFTAEIYLLREGFLKGCKVQAERMYTYDELRKIAYNAFCLGQMDNPTENKFNGWIEQFKK